MNHEFITVDNRRWCVCCDVFQVYRSGAWLPKSGDCKYNTNYARDHGKDKARAPVSGQEALPDSEGNPQGTDRSHS